MLRAIAERDPDAVVAVTTADVVFEPVSTEVAVRTPYHGHEGLRAYIADLTRDWDEFDVTVSEVRPGERHVVVLGRIYARAGGTIADGPAAFVFELRQGLVAWGKTFRDRAEALRFAALE
jgi:ketosteroid isomerase-like protein